MGGLGQKKVLQHGPNLGPKIWLGTQISHLDPIPVASQPSPETIVLVGFLPARSRNPIRAIAH